MSDELLHVLNFTHRATLGGGDDKDGDRGGLDSVAQQQLDRLKHKYSTVFSKPTYPIDRSNAPLQFEHQIPLKDESAEPPKRKLYPLDARELEELKEQLRKFLDSGRIEPANGAYGAPILFAKKKDGGLRMCIDYRMLNAQTRGDVFPLPRIDETLQRLDGATVFSKLDLADGYHQIPMAKADRVKTSFTCRYGTFQFTVMPFGLSTAPSTFQRMMNQVFFPLLDKGVLCYLDDLLIYSKSIDEHVQLLDQVFELLSAHKLYIKESKCHLFLKRVNFLGHVLDENGVSLESGKVDVIRNWPQLTSVQHVQQFLGLCNYYRRFVPRFSEVAGPLTLLTRKHQQFVWGQEQVKAFQTLKDLLCSAPVLKVFDPALPTRVVCDASNFCVGAILEQQLDGVWKTVEFYSKRLSSSERNYSATDREFVAIQQSLARWRHFLVGIHFTLLTDHAALTYLQSSATVNRRNARWLDFLSQFNFDILHIKGKQNVVADALSRLPGSDSLSSIYLCSDVYTLGIYHVDDVAHLLPINSVITISENKTFTKQLLAEQQKSDNTWYKACVQEARRGNTLFQYRNGLLCKLVNDTFCPILPDWRSDTVQIVLSDLHSSALGGHLGAKKLLHAVKKRFYFQHMAKCVLQFCRQCDVCQANKHSTLKPAGLLQPVENPTTPFTHITMDFITHLPRSTAGFDAIFTIVDRFSRYVHFIPCHSNVSAFDVAQLFFTHWVCKFGMPTKIISDRDVKFTSSFWQQLCKLLDCRVALSSSYHPQTDGLSERFHRSLEQILRCYCSHQQQEWSDLLGQCEFALNSSVQDAIDDVPFRVVYGFIPALPLDNTVLSGVQLPAVSDFVSARVSV